MPIYEMTCPNGHKGDYLVPMGTKETTCEVCGAKAKKSRGSYLSAVHGLPNGHIAVGEKLGGKHP